MAKYSESLRKQMVSADVALWRGSRDPMARLIRRVTKSPYSHAALVFELDKRLFVYESVPTGVRFIPLSARVAMLSPTGCIDIFRVPDVDVSRVRRNALVFAGSGYDFGGIGRFAAAKLLNRPPSGDSKRLFCSEMVARAFEIQADLNFIAPGDLPQFGEFVLSISK